MKIAELGLDLMGAISVSHSLILGPGALHVLDLGFTTLQDHFTHFKPIKKGKTEANEGCVCHDKGQGHELRLSVGAQSEECVFQIIYLYELCISYALIVMNSKHCVHKSFCWFCHEAAHI